jgi:hypothetical protein
MTEVRRMAELDKFLDAAPKGALAEGAERFARMVDVVKDQQRARTNSGARIVDTDAFILSPDEAWSKKYMTQCIGPVCTIRPTALGAQGLPGAVAQPQAAPADHAYVAVEAAPAPAGRRRRAAKVRLDPIGIAIGKPVRRRSWLGRLILGS